MKWLPLFLFFTTVFASEEPQSLDDQLIFAAGEGNLEKVKQLLEEGADVNARNQYMETPLHVASIGKNVEVVRTLIEAKANVDAVAVGGDSKRTPIFWYIYPDDHEGVWEIIKANCDLTFQNELGQTPLEFAKEIDGKDGRVVKMIETSLRRTEHMRITSQDRTFLKNDAPPPVEEIKRPSSYGKNKRQERGAAKSEAAKDRMKAAIKRRREAASERREAGDTNSKETMEARMKERREEASRRTEKARRHVEHARTTQGREQSENRGGRRTPADIGAEKKRREKIHADRKSVV